VKKEIERAFFTTRKWFVVGLAYQLPRQGYCVVFRFIIEYSSLRDFNRPLGNNNNNNNRSIYFYEDF
jgi:hypothetical protein